MQHVGIDVHKVSTQVCIVDEDGVVTERRIRTERKRFRDLFENAPHSKILIEASTESEWVARCLEQLGHEVIVADPNFAPMYSTRTRRIKTDKRDARALCDACALGAYRPAYRTSDRSRYLRDLIAVREAQVETRSRYISLIRSLSRRHGYRIRTGGVISFEKRVQEAEIHEQLRREIEPLFAVMRELNVQIKALDEQLEQETRDDEVAERLRTVPGIGPVTALFFVSVVDQVQRFESAHKLAAYLGLVPRELSSGEKRHRGRITKAGNCRLRSLLVEAAWRIVWRPRPETEHLIHWTNAIAARRGKNVAIVALARKLSGILYAMWRDGTCFAPPVPKSKEDLAA